MSDDETKPEHGVALTDAEQRTVLRHMPEWTPGHVAAGLIADVEHIADARIAATDARLAAVEALLEPRPGRRPESDVERLIPATLVRAAIEGRGAGRTMSADGDVPALSTTAPDAGQRDAQVRAEAWREAAEEMEAIITNGDLAEVAAYTPGGHGRSAAIDKRDALYNDPHAWIAARADREAQGARDVH